MYLDLEANVLCSRTTPVRIATTKRNVFRTLKVLRSKTAQCLQYFTDFLTERLRVHGRTKKTKQTCPGHGLMPLTVVSHCLPGSSFVWNSLPHHLRYSTKLKTVQRKAFHEALIKSPQYIFLRRPYH